MPHLENYTTFFKLFILINKIFKSIFCPDVRHTEAALSALDACVHRGAFVVGCFCGF